MILIVEDDPSIRSILSEIFLSEGYRVEAVNDGMAAMTSLRRTVPDAIIADIQMPRLRGDALAAELADWGIPIVLTSAQSYRPAIAGTVFIPKPFDLDELVATVARMIENASTGGEFVHPQTIR